MIAVLILAFGCTGATKDTGAVEVDEDNDGWSEEDDCDDAAADVNPDAAENCDDDLDNDCDEREDMDDDDCSGVDGDHDGYTVSTDCDDADASVYPGAIELCVDGIDGNCDERHDETLGGDHSTASGYCDVVFVGHGDYESISLEEATNIVTAGGEIDVSAGTYSEGATIYGASLTIVGSGEVLFEGEEAGLTVSDSSEVWVSGVDFSEVVTYYTVASAIYIYDNSTLHLSDAVLSRNGGEAAAVHVDQESVFVASGVTFEDNSAEYGGAVWAVDSEVTLDNCEISGNTAESGGPAVEVVRGTTLVYDSVIVGNGRSGGGGAIQVLGAYDEEDAPGYLYLDEHTSMSDNLDADIEFYGDVYSKAAGEEMACTVADGCYEP